MAHKPRGKRLPPERVRENLRAQQHRGHEKTQRQMREQASRTMLLEFFTGLHTRVQAAAQVNPTLRPLVGADWYETLALFSEYITSLRDTGHADRIAGVMQEIGASHAEVLSLAAAALSLGQGESVSQAEPSAV